MKKRYSRGVWKEAFFAVCCASLNGRQIAEKQGKPMRFQIGENYFKPVRRQIGKSALRPQGTRQRKTFVKTGIFFAKLWGCRA